MPPRLEVAGLTLRFGGLTSLDDVSFRLDPGTVLAVIGPNGAGKTSLFNCLTGVYRPQRGRVVFRPPGGEAVDVIGRSPHAVNRLGMARTFQHTRLFGGLNAFENVQVGVEARRRAGALRDLLPYRVVRRERDGVNARVWKLLDAVGLAHRAGEPAASLPYGEQRRLEIARALGTRPSLLLLDEPAAGASAQERRELAALVRRIAAGGISVLLIEHDVPLVMSLATSVVVLNFGRVIAVGTPERVRRDPAVVEAYLGVGHADTDAGPGPGPGSADSGPATAPRSADSGPGPGTVSRSVDPRSGSGTAPRSADSGPGPATASRSADSGPGPGAASRSVDPRSGSGTVSRSADSGSGPGTVSRSADSGSGPGTVSRSADSGSGSGPGTVSRSADSGSGPGPGAASRSVDPRSGSGTVSRSADSGSGPGTVSRSADSGSGPGTAFRSVDSGTGGGAHASGGAGTRGTGNAGGEST